MLWLAPLVFLVIGALGAMAMQWTGRPVYAQDMIFIAGGIAVATELSLIAIRLLKGPDQAAAAQAGLTGMVLLMLLTVGILTAGRFMGVIAHADALTQWSPLYFMAALILVAGDAIRTIRRAPTVKAKSGHPDVPADKTGNQHV